LFSAPRRLLKNLMRFGGFLSSLQSGFFSRPGRMSVCSGMLCITVRDLARTLVVGRLIAALLVGQA